MAASIAMDLDDCANLGADRRPVARPGEKWLAAISRQADLDPLRNSLREALELVDKASRRTVLGGSGRHDQGPGSSAVQQPERRCRGCSIRASETLLHLEPHKLNEEPRTRDHPQAHEDYNDGSEDSKASAVGRPK